MNKKISLMIIAVLLFSFIPFVSAWCLFDFIGTTCEEVEGLDKIKAEFTPFSTDIIRDKHEHSLTIYDFPHNVYEDNQWKPYTEARNLMGKEGWGYEILSDNEHIIKPIKFNATEIIINLSLSALSLNTNKNIPIKVDGIEAITTNLKSISDSKIFSIKSKDMISRNVSFGFNSTTISLTATGAPINDSMGSAAQADFNFGASTSVFVGRSSSGGTANNTHFIEVNYSIIPSHAIIEDAELNISVWKHADDSGFFCPGAGFYYGRALIEWYECSVPGSASQDGCVSWNNASSVSWTVGGGLGPGDDISLDYNFTTYGCGAYAAEDGIIWINGTNHIADVQGWVNESYDPFGYIGRTPPMLADRVAVGTKETSNVTRRPVAFVRYESNRAPSIPSLNLPANETFVNETEVSLNWTNSTDLDGDAITYYLEVDNDPTFTSVDYVNHSINETNTGSLGVTGDFITTLDEGFYYWRVLAYDFQENSSFSAIRSFNLSNPFAPTNPDIFPTGTHHNFSFNSICENSTGEGTINYEFWFDSSNPPTTILQNSTTTTYSLDNQTNGTYYFRCRTNNGTFNSLYTDTTIINFDTTEIWANKSKINDSVNSGTVNNFTLNITFNNQSEFVTDVTAELHYDGSSISMNKENIEANKFGFSQTAIAPDTTSSLSLNYRLNLTYFNGTKIERIIGNFTQAINELKFGFCNTSLINPFVNFSFQDEKNSSTLEGKIVASTFNYSANSDLSNAKTFTYSNSTPNPTYAFCATPNITLYVDADIDYEASGYPQRTYEESLTLTNTTTNKTLFMAFTLDGQTVTFQVINSAQQVLDEVDVTVTKDGNLVEAGSTNDAGAISFFLNPDFTYTFVFIKSGFETFTTSIRPTETTYTVTLAATETVTDNVNQDVNYSVFPTADKLDNETFYNFTFEVESGFFIIQSGGFTLRNTTSGIAIGSAVCIGTANQVCSSSLNTTTGNFTEISMNFFWEVNNSFGNGTKIWVVRTTPTFRGAFTYFKEDLERFGSGFDNFTKALISFFIILVVVGSLTLISGQRSPLAILGETAALVFLLDQINLIPNPPGAVEHFTTIIVVMLFIAYTIFESRRLV